MYLFYDKTGKLKEYINDEALRQGNYDINTIFVYVEDRNVTSIDVSYLLPSGLIVGPENFNRHYTGQIPFDEKRDLKFFKYYTDYIFIEIDLTTDINGNYALQEAGLVHSTLSANLAGGNILTLGEFNFDVEVDAVANTHYVATQEYLSLADYQFLRSLISEHDIGYIELSGNSGSLTQLQIDECSKEYCIIKRAGVYYFKYYNEEDNIWEFSEIPGYVSTTESGNVNYRLHKYYITIDLDSGDWEFVNAMSNKIYDKNAVDTLIADNKYGYVELGSVSGTLTDSQYAEINKDFCVIVFGEKLYFKAYGEGAYIYFLNLDWTVSGDTRDFTRKMIAINITNKAWQYGSNTSTLYTKTSVDTLLDLKADKSDTYTKTEVDSLISNYYDKDDIYIIEKTTDYLDNLTTITFTQDEVNKALASKECIIILSFTSTAFANSKYIFRMTTKNTSSGRLDFTYTSVSSSILVRTYRIVINGDGTNNTSYSGTTEFSINANPLIPSGTTPTQLLNLKIGSGYYTIPNPETATTADINALFN